MSSVIKQSKVEPLSRDDATGSGAAECAASSTANTPVPANTPLKKNEKQSRKDWFKSKKEDVNKRTFWPRPRTLVGWGLAGSVIFYAFGQVADLRLAAEQSLDVMRSGISSITEKLDGLKAQTETTVEFGRPLLPQETPITKPLTNRETLAEHLNVIQDQISSLKANGNERLSASFAIKLRRFKKGLLLAQALRPVPNAKIEEAPIQLSESLNEDWYQGAIDRLNEHHLYNNALQEKKRSSHFETPTWEFSTPVKLAPEESSGNPRMKMDTVYLATGTVWFLERAKAISLPTGYDSLAILPDSMYYCKGDTLSKLDIALDVTETQWCPGHGPMQIAKSDAALLVRRDKLYRLDSVSNSWRVIDTPQLPRTPMVWSASENSIVTLGRSDNGRISFLHVFNETGELQKTIRLSTPIVIPDKFSWHMVMSDTQLIVITESGDLRNRNVWCVDMRDGTIGMSHDLSLKRNSKLEKQNPTSTDSQS